jgi:predicted ABC-type ATPase
MSLLSQAIQAVDRALLFDNSANSARLVAEFQNGKQIFGVTDAPQWVIHQ